MKPGIIFTIIPLAITLSTYSQVGINSDGSSPDASAILDVKSIDKGLLIPRMTTEQRLSIMSPVEGLMVYDTDLGSLCFYRSGTWNQSLYSTSGWSLKGNADIDQSSDFLGTTDNNPLVFKFNNTTSGYIDATSTFFGYTAGQNNMGIYNTLVGSGAGWQHTHGNSNTAIGYEALNNNSAGSDNTALGSQAGAAVTTGSGHVWLGFNAGNNARFDTLNNVGGIENTGTANPLLYFDFANDSVIINGNLRINNGKGESKGLSVTVADSVLQDGSSNTGTDLIFSHTYEAFKFIASDEYPLGVLGPVSVFLKKDEGVNNITGAIQKYIYSDNSGVPGTMLTVITEPEFYGHLGTAYSEFPSQNGSPGLTSGSSYWIVMVRTAAATGGNIYLDTKNTGTAMYAYSSDGTNWTTEDNVTGAYKLYYQGNPALDIEASHHYGIETTSITEYGLYAESVYDAAVRGKSICASGLVGNSVYHSAVVGVSEHGIGVRGIARDDAGVYGSSENYYGLIGVTDSSEYYGVWGSSEAGGGVLGTSISNYGTTGTSITGNGIYAYSKSGTPFYAYGNPPATNSMSEILKLSIGSSGIAADGIGSSINWYNQNDAGSEVLVGKIGAVSSCVNSGSEQGALVFYTKGGDGISERMRINSSGFVGIGTISPTQSLEVSGSIQAGENLLLPATTASAGQLRINNSPVLHNYGTDNLFIGDLAGNFTLSGTANTAIGTGAGNQISTGSENTYLGRLAGHSNSTGSGNLMLGHRAGFYETGNNKLYVANSDADSVNALIFGNFATNMLTVNGALIVNDRIATPNAPMLETGYLAMLASDGTVTKMDTAGYKGGNDNLGNHMAASDLNMASNNIKSADSIELVNLITTGNILMPNTTAAKGIIYRESSPWLHNNGSGNAFMGKDAGNLTHSGGENNTGIGDSTLAALTSGSFNVGIGTAALKRITTGAYNTAVGYSATCSINDSNTISIGYCSTADASNQVRLGNSDITSLYCLGAYTGTIGNDNVDLFADNTGKIGFIASSARYKDQITVMENVNWLYDLRPVNFIYKSDEKKKKQYGLIAEEVEKVNPDFVHYNNEGQAETVSYSQLIAPMIRVIQEQNNTITELKIEMDLIKAERELILSNQEMLKSRIEALEHEKETFSQN